MTWDSCYSNYYCDPLQSILGFRVYVEKENLTDGPTLIIEGAYSVVVGYSFVQFAKYFDVTWTHD